MPKDRYSKQNAVNRTTRSINKPRFLTRPLRKCPSCRQDAVIETHIMSEKVILRCRNCHLRYELTRFPIFEEVDYYNKMLDIYRTENWTRKSDKSNITNKGTDKESDDGGASQENSSNCPICKMGNLWASAYFIRGYQIIKCNNDDCHATFQAPKGGCFQVSEDRCIKCGWPIVTSKDILTKSACFNPNCAKQGIVTIK